MSGRLGRADPQGLCLQSSELQYEGADVDKHKITSSFLLSRAYGPRCVLKWLFDCSLMMNRLCIT